MSDAKEARRRAWVEQMRPGMDASLNQFFDAMESAMQAASEAEIDRCIAIVDMVRPKNAPEMWTKAIDMAVDSLRSWKKESSGQAGGPDNAT
jgi:hypothetical protein